MSGIWDKLYQLYLLHCTALLRISFLLLFYWSILDACMADKSIESRFWIGKDFTTLIIKWAVHGQRFCQSPFNLGISESRILRKGQGLGRVDPKYIFFALFLKNYDSSQWKLNSKYIRNCYWITWNYVRKAQISII